MTVILKVDFAPGHKTTLTSMTGLEHKDPLDQFRLDPYMTILREHVSQFYL